MSSSANEGFGGQPSNLYDIDSNLLKHLILAFSAEERSLEPSEGLD